MDIPKQTGEIFDILSKGQFICSNSSIDTTRRLYDIIDGHYFEELYHYFKAINFILEKGDEYFYFSKIEPKAELERKIEAAFRWIDLIDFFKAYDTSFASGFRFTPANILVRIQIDAILKTKAEALKRYTKEDTLQAGVQKLVDMLCREGFAELENEISSQYKVLASFHYLEQLVLKINIPEEVQNAIPQ